MYDSPYLFIHPSSLLPKKQNKEILCYTLLLFAHPSFEVVIAKKQNKEIVCYTLYVDIVDIYSKF